MTFSKNQLNYNVPIRVQRYVRDSQTIWETLIWTGNVFYNLAHIATLTETTSLQEYKWEKYKIETRSYKTRKSSTGSSKEVAISYQLISTNPGRIFSKNLCSSVDRYHNYSKHVILIYWTHQLQDPILQQGLLTPEIYAIKITKQTGSWATLQTKCSLLLNWTGLLTCMLSCSCSMHVTQILNRRPCCRYDVKLHSIQQICIFSYIY